MSRLLSRWQQPNAEGRTQSVTPESAGWGYVGFEAYELQEGQTLTLPAVSAAWCWLPGGPPSARLPRSLTISASG